MVFLNIRKFSNNLIYHLEELEKEQKPKVSRREKQGNNKDQRGGQKIFL